MFSQLGDKLQDIFKDLRGHGTISGTNINDALGRSASRCSKRMSISGRQISSAELKKALGEEVLRSVTPGQQSLRFS
jgi:signal recognition particle subunit SRP54